MIIKTSCLWREFPSVSAQLSKHTLINWFCVLSIIPIIKFDSNFNQYYYWDKCIFLSSWVSAELSCLHAVLSLLLPPVKGFLWDQKYHHFFYYTVSHSLTSSYTHTHPHTHITPSCPAATFPSQWKAGWFGKWWPFITAWCRISPQSCSRRTHSHTEFRRKVEVKEAERLIQKHAMHTETKQKCPMVHGVR